jgi:cytochrome c oxidase subunit II
MTNETNKKSLKSFLILWAILTVFGIVVSLTVFSHYMPKSMSDNQHLTILTVVIFSVAAAPVAAGVYAASYYALRHWTYRGETPPPAAEAVRENNVLTTTWVLTSLVLTVFLLIWGLGALAVDNSSTGKNPLVVDVTGQQWVWSFAYPGTHVQSNELYLPEGREVIFHVESKDVTHGFWIAQMGVQVDANVGTVTEMHTTPNKLGTFDIRCTQFCGLNHAFMVTQGHVVTPTQFNNWLAAQPQRS